MTVRLALLLVGTGRVWDIYGGSAVLKGRGREESYSTFCCHKAKEGRGIKSLVSLLSCGLIAIVDSMIMSRLIIMLAFGIFLLGYINKSVRPLGSSIYIFRGKDLYTRTTPLKAHLPDCYLLRASCCYLTAAISTPIFTEVLVLSWPSLRGQKKGICGRKPLVAATPISKG
jgi:hypothetical protein